jgi:hypothetical protein
MSLIILLGDAITCPKIGYLKGPLISECMLIGGTKAIPGAGSLKNTLAVAGTAVESIY